LSKEDERATGFEHPAKIRGFKARIGGSEARIGGSETRIGALRPGLEAPTLRF